MKFEEKVKIASGFRRSVNIERDQSDLSLLKNYVCTPLSENILFLMCRHIKQGQCAFTWTGPYGAGKSSLAVFLSALAKGQKEAYNIAIQKLSDNKAEIKELFPLQYPRDIVAVTGRPESPVQTLSRRLGTEATSAAILADLTNRLQKKSGVILFVDEMGKFLEKAVNNKAAEIYLFQQIAELANRSAGRLILVGILHQSFIEYSRNLSFFARDEWHKIQGRFVDLAVNVAGEEQIDLISRAILCAEKPQKATIQAKVTAEVIARNKPVQKDILSGLLNACWPLHPITASLLGTLSRKRFGQNQRSIFSFLSSAEPLGFQFFLKQYEFRTDKFYTPYLYWDYIKINLESAILTTSDAQLWTIATEAINKCSVAAKCKHSSQILQTIAIINIFKGDSGLMASEPLLETVFDSLTLEAGLTELERLSLIRYNKYSASYSLSETSDFSLEAELETASWHIHDIDFSKLNKIASFRPVVAKRHYHETGAMRWMEIRLIQLDDLEDCSEKKHTHAFGEFLIIMPKNAHEYEIAQEKIGYYKNKNPYFPQFMAIAKNYQTLLSYSRELLALEWLKNNSGILSTDKVARNEVERQFELIYHSLADILNKTLIEAIWHMNAKKVGCMNIRQIASKVSDLADITFSKSPRLRSEMLNRNKPSGNARAAMGALLKHMISHNGEEHLNIPGSRPEGSLCKILFEETAIYRKNSSGKWEFCTPQNDRHRLSLLWEKTDDILKEINGNVTLNKIYAEWDHPPFGIKKGLRPCLMLAYILSRKDHVAVYLREIYLQDINEIFTAYLVKDSEDIGLRYVKYNGHTQNFLREFTAFLRRQDNLNLKISPNPSSLELAQALVGITERINPWVMRTRSLSSKAIKLRDILKTASDPNKLIFDDIPALFAMKENQEAGMRLLSQALQEITSAYQNLLKDIGKLLMSELQVGIPTNQNLERLHIRARNINHVSGDFRIEALAARLANFVSTEEDIAGIASLAVNKTTRDWIDLDVERAKLEIAILCQEFKKAELYAHVKGRQQNRHALAILSGLSGEEKIHQLFFEVREEEKHTIKNIQDRAESALSETKDVKLILAALAELSAKYMDLIKGVNTKE